MTGQNSTTIMYVKYETVRLGSFCTVICGHIDRQTYRQEDVYRCYAFI